MSIPNDSSVLVNQIIAQVIDLLRGKVRVHDYHSICYLLLLQKEGVIQNTTRLVPERLYKDIIEKVANGTYEHKRIISDLLLLYQAALREIDSFTLFKLLKLIESIDSDFLEKHIEELIENVIYHIANAEGRSGGEYVQPLELTSLICGLSDLPEGASVYNPFAGVASFGVYLRDGIKYFGQEINQFTWATGIIRLIASGKISQSDYVTGNSIVNWNPFGRKYDLIVANPPLGMRIKEDTRGMFGPIRTTEHFIIERGVQDLCDDGKLIVIVPEGILFRAGADRELRRYLVEENMLEAVISLPAKLLMNTSISVSILIINKCKRESGVTRFINAKKFLDQDNKLDYLTLIDIVKRSDITEDVRIVQNQKLRDSDYKLTVSRYFQKDIRGTELGIVLSEVHGQRGDSFIGEKFVKASDLKDDKLEYFLDTDKLGILEMTRYSQLIKESCLLLSVRWSTLKPTYFLYTGEPIVISPDIKAFKVNERLVHTGYLVNELHADYVTEQVRLYQVGAVMPSIRIEDLLKVKIDLPGPDQQKDRIRVILEALAEEKKKELILFQRIHGLEAEIMEQNTYLRHTLTTPATNLKASIINVKKILLEQVLPLIPSLMNFKVSEDHKISLGKYLEIIERDASKVSDTVGRQLKVDWEIELMRCTPIDIISFLEEFANEHNEQRKSNYTLSFDYDKEVFLYDTGETKKTFILSNTDLLHDLFNNLISNAVEHAFGPGKDNRIEIYLSKSTDREVQILFSNTGKPFPKPYTIDDFTRKGFSAGVKAGDGFGGWYINELVKRMYGRLSMVDDLKIKHLSGSDLVTSFEMIIPITEADEEEV